MPTSLAIRDDHQTIGIFFLIAKSRRSTLSLDQHHPLWPWVSILSAIILAVLLVGAAAREPMIADCDSDILAKRIAGCSALIASWSFTPNERALAYGRRADARMHEGALASAIADLAKAIELDPADSFHRKRLAVAYLTNGDAFADRNNLDRAFAAYTAAIEIDANSVAALIARAGISLKRNDLDGAFTDLVKVAQLPEPYRPVLASLHDRQGTKQHLSGNLEAAVRSYDAAVSLHPANPDFRLHRANALLQLGRSAPALADFNAVIAENTLLSAAYLGRGSVYLSTQQFKQALVDFTAGLEITPDDIDLRLGRALALEFVDRPVEARLEYDRVLDAQPGNEIAEKGSTRARDTLLGTQNR